MNVNGKLQPIMLALLFIIAAGGLVWVSLKDPSSSISREAQEKVEALPRGMSVEPPRLPRQRLDVSQPRSDLGDEHPLARKNERVARFDSDEAYRKFLAEMNRRGLRLLGRSDALRAIRFSFDEESDLEGLNEDDFGYNYIVSIPLPPRQGEAQAGAAGFGQNALSWLGVRGDNSGWGKGITVAVIDSGVNIHPAFVEGKGSITRINLTELAEGETQLGHGTAVASIISGDHSRTPGLAPAADVLSIRITDSDGTSDSFTLAEGIVQAVDGGARVINISMGSQGDSRLVEDAVNYAREKGAVIVASTGNEGVDAVSYPAAYDGVIAVGAVEAQGEHLDFSNSGEQVGITAPGYQVNAAWGDEQLTAFSGTSASAPFVSGAIAAAMSENPHLTAQQAANLVLANTNDSGFPGNDVDYGRGVLDVGRVMEHGTPGVYDAAISSQILVAPENPNELPQVWVTVQNQGTETLTNSPLVIDTPNGNHQVNISSLAPGQIQTYKYPVAIPNNGTAVQVHSSVKSTAGDNDPANNSRSSEFMQTQPAE